MTLNTKRLGSEPIIIVVWENPLDVRRDVPNMWKEVDNLIKAGENKIYCVNDLKNVTVDLSTLISGMALQQGSKPGSASDPRIRTMLVGSGPVWKIASQAFKQVRHGDPNVQLFSTIEDALTYIREEVKNQPHY